ncbi:hypothetical protein Aca07nite_84920 [Actinoplanes capillaceus]|uniref:Uncharacterized protein n=1 Tax=Actinoplanes campanulatus TaxID=113559 RepID=A0ABQ3WY48_9ACTN|nr:hypothetical protein Aca07nite_84920 [Actinoplanes capillaceus]
MTERIGELLNEAVADVEPATVDPVGAMLRRGRSARRRSALIAAVVCAGLTSAVLLPSFAPLARQLFDNDDLPAALARGSRVASGVEHPRRHRAGQGHPDGTSAFVRR